MKLGIFVLGSDTDVGKTHFSARLAQLLRSFQFRVGAYKPVASGFRWGHPDSDPMILSQSCGIATEYLDRVCPQSFQAALSPAIAAGLENRTVDEKLLLTGAKWWEDQCDILIVESAGGLLSPISGSMTSIDLASQLNFPLVLIVQNRLGAVNQTLLAVEAIKNRGDLELLAVVLNSIPGSGVESGNPAESQDLIDTTNFELIQRFSPGIPLFCGEQPVAELIAARLGH